MISKYRRAFLIILDGVGIGSAPDASVYGDEGSDTLGNLSRKVGGLNLPHLKASGLGNLSEIRGVEPVDNPLMSYGRMQEVSAGKDSVTGHWEICGVVTEKPFPVFPEGFPQEVVNLVRNISGREIIGNQAASGTEIMDRLGQEHCESGNLILYTSADSVLQILAHEEIVPLEELYRICKDIRNQLEDPYKVARIIARPFLGANGNFIRTPNRKDFAIEPHDSSVLDLLLESGIPVTSIGKVDTLFAGRGFTDYIRTKNNADGITKINELLESREEGLVFANLIDFDMQWGHRNDVEGFKAGLEELDESLPRWIKNIREYDLIIITADHGNDPTTISTDHSREHVPLLATLGGKGIAKNLGLRIGFYDIAATIAEYFDIYWDKNGNSFLGKLRSN